MRNFLDERGYDDVTFAQALMLGLMVVVGGALGLVLS